MADRKGTHRVLVGKPEGMTPLGRPRRRLNNNIKIGHIEIGWEGADWIDMN
jgi:hypothetical protein